MSLARLQDAGSIYKNQCIFEADSQKEQTSGYGVGVREGKCRDGGIEGTNYWLYNRLNAVLNRWGIEPTFCNNYKWKVTFKNIYKRASLVAQWLKINLPI